MVRSHAKNNTTQANLTHYERSLLRQPGAARRLGRDSFKPLDHCNLCLVRAVDPVACTRAHLYCRECALNSLITQKAGIEAQKRELARWEADDAARRADAREAARARVVSDFEKGLGLGSVRRTTSSSAGKEAAAPDLEGEIERRQREAEAAAAATIEAEQAEQRKAKLAAFWLPSLAPEAPLGPLKAVKLQTLCHYGEPHGFARKSLLPVQLHYPAQSDKPHCPSCAKELSNASPGVLLASRVPAAGADGEEPVKKKAKREGKKKEDAPAVCGHVVCKTCADTVVAPAKACPICDAVVEASGMLPLGKEGTGFAAAGGAEVKKATIAFRV
ncbi:hypothetical protein Q8F55_005122 [Vanrija albida]|uniref:RING-type domain-containing protein n=1 Tax=Vanrija albida TaxID=181172 RepID=A0ABR3Q1E9_9TREE